jgi:cyclopropane-fatty-acyl-phospholipid synthase
MPQLRPFFENVQATYDVGHSTEFVSLFLDPGLVYSCAYFERDDMTLEEAQLAKLDLALGKCDLRPGHRLLDVGCGWGACAQRAATRYGAHVIGLTLSKKQHDWILANSSDQAEGGGRIDVRLQGWEEFDEPIDRIVSIGAFEHFRQERHAAFFERCHDLLPEDGRLLLHTIVWSSPTLLDRLGVQVTHENVLFGKFIRKEIFRGGMLCMPEQIVRHAQAAGFRVLRIHSLREHYARTLDTWATNLEANRQQAVNLSSEKIYDQFMHYLTGCARHFRSGHIDVIQFTLLVK